MQDQGRPVDPDFVDSQGLKASGAKPEMVGQSAPTGQGAQDLEDKEMQPKPDISITRPVTKPVDKAVKKLVLLRELMHLENQGQ